MNVLRRLVGGQSARPSDAATTARSATSSVAWGFLAVVLALTPLTELPAVSVLPAHGLVVVLSVLAVVVGLRLHRPAIRRQWIYLATALSLYAVGGAVYGAGGDASKVMALLIHAVGWTALLRALILVLHERRLVGDRDGLIDSLIATVGVAVAAWVVLFEPVSAAQRLPIVERLVVMAYPLLDVFALPLVVRLTLTGGRTVPALRLLLLALLGGTAANTLYAYATWTGMPVEATYILYRANYALVGAAALHPSMVCIGRPDDRIAKPVTAARFGLLGAAALVPPALLWLPWLRGVGIAIPVISLGSIVIFALVSVRMWRLVRTVERLTARRGERRFRSLIHNADDVIAVVGDGGLVRFITPSVERWGHRAEAIVGQPITEFVDPEDLDRWFERRTTGDGERLPAFHGRVRTASGEWRDVDGAIADLTEDPDVAGIVVTLHDVTDRNRLQQELAHRAEHDGLTGLPNRSLFHAAVGRIDHGGSTHGTALLFVDVDDFKGFNDSLGHAAGDELLTVVARRLRHGLRSADLPARLGGDEFAVLLRGVDVDRARAVADRLLGAVEAPIVLADREVVVRASIGLAIGGEDIDAATLLRNADVAMYAAKNAGKGRVQEFDADLLQEALWRQQVTAMLPEAIVRGELRLDYQPILRTGGDVVAAEALLRWDHPDLGTVAPLSFIPIAEETGLILDIGRWVLHEACRTAVAWQHDGDGVGRAVAVAVNVSVVQLRSDALVADVASSLRATGLRPENLLLEVTESVLADDTTVAQLHRLKALGIRVAVDDFGTGYSSLRYLQEFPLDVLKIDRSFVDVVTTDPTLPRAIIGLASSLGLLSLAEGVERPEQASALAELGCELVQGYLYARPGGAADVARRLRDRAGRRAD